MPDLIQRIDAAIGRLRQNTDPALAVTVAISITNLQEKRRLVLDNNYVVRQVNEEACAAIGHLIAELTQRTLLRSSHVGARSTDE